MTATAPRLPALLLAAALVAGCGMYGPLYLPVDEAEAPAPVEEQPPVAIPDAPEEAGGDEDEEDEEDGSGGAS